MASRSVSRPVPAAAEITYSVKIQRAKLVEQFQPAGRLGQIDLVGHDKRAGVGKAHVVLVQVGCAARRVLVSFSRSSTSWHCSTPSSLPRSTIKRTRSAERTRLWMCGSMKSLVTGGVSISWTVTSSKGIIAGAGVWVVKGYGATSGVARVRLQINWLLPALGPPRRIAVPAPCRGMRRPRPLFLPLFLGDQILLELGDLGLQVGLEVVGPLVLGDLLEHDLEAGQFFLAGRGPAVFCLGLQVLLGEIGWHNASVNKTANIVASLLHSRPAD